ncbi:MAG: hypothetical protein U0271_23890 [Polyangiaceae bacterium]
MGPGFIHNPYAPPVYAPGPPPMQNNGTSATAGWALGLAIAGWVLCGCLTSLPALFLARSELSAIDRGDSPAGGRGMATAAFWIAVVNVALYAILVCVYVVVFALAARHP